MHDKLLATSLCEHSLSSLIGFEELDIFNLQPLALIVGAV